MFAQLLWTSERIAHVARHGLTPEEVEQAVFDDPYRRLRRGPRSRARRHHFLYYVYGRTGAGRYLFVVLLDRGQGRALPITARDMTPRERRWYEEG